MGINLFKACYQVEECVESIRQVLTSGWSGQGSKCTELEKQWEEYTGAKNAHFVSSATAALHIAVKLLNLPKDTPIATTPITFVSTNAAILYEGLRPIFCDVGEDLSLSFASVKRAIEEKGATAVMWVHYGGSVSDDFYELMEYVEIHGHVKVIEDCAHAAGAFYNDGSRVGSRRDTVSCFSYHSVKNMPIFDGGMICIPENDKHERAKKLSWMGIDKSTYARTSIESNEVYKWSYDVPELGWKYNGNDVAASIGLVQLKYLDRDNAYRYRIAQHYSLILDDMVGIVPHSVGSSHHLMVVSVKDRDGTIARMKANGISPGVHYLPNYIFPVFKDFDHEDCARVEDLSKKIISLPNHMCLTLKDVEMICGVLNGEKQ